MFKKLSAAEISELQQVLNLRSLPSTTRGISLKAAREGWQGEQVDGKGGKGGKKNVFDLPDYVIEELREKGALALLEEEQEAAPKERMQEAKQPYKASKALELPPSMRAVVAGYDDWAAAQDKAQIVPVRY